MSVRSAKKMQISNLQIPSRQVFQTTRSRKAIIFVLQDFIGWTVFQNDPLLVLIESIGEKIMPELWDGLGSRELRQEQEKLRLVGLAFYKQQDFVGLLQQIKMDWRLIIVVLTLQISLTASQTPTYNSFLQFKQQHQKSYADQTEEIYRFYVYTKNVQTITDHNRDPTRTHEAGINKFTDLTWEEFQQVYLTLRTPPDFQSHQVSNDHPNLQQEEESADGHPKVGQNSEHPNVGVCTPNINASGWHNKTTSNPYPAVVFPNGQGECGGCYAFATAELLSTMVSIQKKVNFTFSPQQIIDCDPTSNGCDGGWPPYTLQYYASDQGIASIQKYPYTQFTFKNGLQGQCKQTITGPYKVAKVTTTASSTTATKNCPALLSQVAKTPMVVIISVSSAFVSYASGVLDIVKCPARSLNHAIYLVGVDNCNNWIIQNSWGLTWGTKGFGRLAPNNTCNICLAGGTYTTML